MKIKFYFVSGHTCKMDNVQKEIYDYIKKGVGLNYTVTARNSIINLLYVEQVEIIESEE